MNLAKKFLLGSFLSLYSFSFFAQGILVCVNGSSCSGKSTIINEFITITNGAAYDTWVSASMDDAAVKKTSSAPPDQQARNFLVKTAKCLIDKGFNVICDMGIKDKYDWEWFFKKFPNTRIIKVFVDCKLYVLINRLTTRNLHAYTSNKRDDVREINQIFDFINEVFSLTNSDPRLNKIKMEDVAFTWEYARQVLSEESLNFLMAYYSNRFPGILSLSIQDDRSPGFKFGEYDLVLDNSNEGCAKDCALRIWNAIRA